MRNVLAKAGVQWVISFVLGMNLFASGGVFAAVSPLVQGWFLLSMALYTIYKNDYRDAWKDLKLGYFASLYFFTVVTKRGQLFL